MPIKKEERLPTLKIVARGLGVGASTIAAVATLVFTMTGRPARADDGISILDGIKPRVLSEAELDRVYAGFMRNGPDLYDQSGFYYNYIGNYKIGDKIYPIYASSLVPENKYAYIENTDTLVSVTPNTGATTVLIGDTLNSRVYDQRGVEISGVNVPFLPTFPR